MTRPKITAVSALALLLSAGAATGQTGVRENTERQNRQQTRQPGVAPERAPQRNTERAYGQRAGYEGNIRLMEAEDILGSNLIGARGEEFGAIEDMIVDRGTGEIRFVVLRVNSVLGFGGDHLAVAYHQLEWSDSEDGFRTGMTEEQAKRLGTMLPDDWDELRNTGWMNQIDPRRAQRPDPRMGDAMRSGESAEFKGRIANVGRRVEAMQGGADEHVVLQVLTEDGETREVVLGPSWYIMGQENSPFRGQPITVRGVEHEGRFIASSVTIDGRDLELRRQDGSEAWGESGNDNSNRPDRDTAQPERTDRPTGDRPRNDRPTGERTQPQRRPGQTDPAGDRMTDAQREAERAARQNTERRENYVDRNGGADAGFAGRYFLLSNLEDAEANARGVRSGEVEAVVVEINSGKVAFVGFDPNENFLGIGDEALLVPWSVVSFGQNRLLNIDSDAETIKRIAEMPDDLTELNTTATLAPIYQAFGVEMPDFRPAAENRQGRDGTDATRDPMGERRPNRPGTDRPTRPTDRP